MRAGMKRVFALTSSIILTASFYLTANAQTAQQYDNVQQAGTLQAMQAEAIQPRWTNVSSVSAYLSFNNGRGSLSSTVIAMPGTNSITGRAVLERFNSNGTYTQVASWDLTANNDYLTFSQTYYVSRGYVYRLAISATAYRNGIAETVSASQSAYAD